MTPATLIAGALTLALLGSGYLMIRKKPLHNPSHDDADMDDLHVSAIARRGRGFSSFHASEIADD